MDWAQAKEETLALWLRIRAMIEKPDELELLTEINAVCDLCDAAQAEDPQEFGRCKRCLAYKQFGGCQEINAEMSERVVAKDWDGLRTLVDEFIDALRTLEVPTTAELEN